ncbi:SPRY domain-containing protein [Aphelenchoides fujianensis]|nr:SPRY domain-containing protein [Aphelenchoides fujianensis]KAI6240680.1 SPRY domain-containing protein [Aphelenchoides fujianensis]
MHYFFPFRQCLDCVQGPSYQTTQSYAQLRDEANAVKLSTSHMGPDVVLLKNCTRICGLGGALATAPIVQNKAFFQVDITQNGVWGIGLAHRSADLERVPVLAEAWVLRSDGEVWENGQLLGKVDAPPQEGDSVCVTFDHVDLKFYRNGQPLPITINSVRGQVYPLLYTGDNAILDVRFRSTTVVPPHGFEEASSI